MSQQKRTRQPRPANVIQVNVDFPSEEHKIACQKAAALGMSLAKYIRYCAVNSNFKISQGQPSN